VSAILVVEDEERIASFLARGLRAAGFVPTVVGSGGDAVAHLVEAAPALVLLDLGLPDVDGHDVLAHLRQHHPDVPVVVLTARTGARDTIAALEGGAIDYVTKPFRFDELVARVRLRISARPAVADRELGLGPVRLDLAARRCRVEGREVELSPREFDLLAAFARHPGHALSRDQLRRQAWGGDEDGGSNVVDVHVAALRRKIGVPVLTTVRGVGYRADAPPS
jgi:two-component system copper resistance phosphate regulon response regulator CusR